MMDKSLLNIREVITSNEIRDVMFLHKTIWGIDDIRVIPEHIIIAVEKTNGLVLCAYLNDKPVGFSFGFWGVSDNTKPYFYSHNLGVLPEFQNYGIGYQLKLKQRDIILEKGISLIKWTFDPLESRNAYFNMKLGCIIKEYKRDYYGAMPDKLNSNLPSDRFIAEWWLESEHAIKSLANLSIFQPPTKDKIINLTEKKNDFLIPINTNLEKCARNGEFFVEVPINYHVIRQNNMDLAIQWRLHLRKIFEHCFNMGKYIYGFYSDKEFSYYILK